MDKQIEELANDLQEAWTAWRLSKDLTNPYVFVAEILTKKWHTKIPECVVDYIENYKEGFKEGVVALKMQLEERAEKGTVYTIFNKYVTYSIGGELLDEICKELVDE